jgi:long-subunit fatty acid transport protein
MRTLGAFVLFVFMLGRGALAAQAPSQPPPPKPATTPAAPADEELSWADDFWVTVNGFAQVTTTSFSQSGTFEEFQEDGTFNANYKTKLAPGVDAGIAYKIHGNFGVGVAVSYVDGKADVDVDAQIPHPFFFNRPRPVSGESSVTRRETGIHFQAVYVVPISKTFNIMLSGGPSAIIVDQGVVNDIAYTHEFPYDTATFESAVAPRVKKTAAGLNAGVDLAWKLNDRFGVGALVRYSWANVDLRASDRNTISTTAGGLGVGGGLRIFF